MDTKPQSPPIIPKQIQESANLKEGWDSCVWCGGKSIEVDIKFGSGSVEPTVGETITGATSEATCVLVSVSLLTGTYAGGDAAGWFKCSAPSTWDFDTLRWGSEDENLNGSTSGDNFATLDEYGEIKKYGNLYPESELIERDGKKMCRAHHDWYYGPKDRDDQIINIQGADRGQTW